MLLYRVCRARRNSEARHVDERAGLADRMVVVVRPRRCGVVFDGSRRPVSSVRREALSRASWVVGTWRKSWKMRDVFSMAAPGLRMRKQCVDIEDA